MAFTPAKAIREKVKAKQIIAAQEILSQYQDSLSPNQREELSKLVAQHFSQAKNLAFEASLLENQGKLTEAKDLLERVKEIAVDYPGLDPDIERLEEAGHLARYVRKRSERIRENIPKQRAKKHRQSTGIIVVVLLVAVSTGLLLLSRNEQLPVTENTKEEHILSQNEEIEPATDKVPQPEETSSAGSPQVAMEPDKPSQDQPIAQQQPLESLDTNPEVAAEQNEPQKEEEQATIGAMEESEREATTPASERLAMTPPAEEPPAADTMTPARPIDEDVKIHIVEEGDSLSLLAHRYYCNEQERYKLYLMNRDILADPNELVIGQRLRLTSPEMEIDNLCDSFQ